MSIKIEMMCANHSREYLNAFITRTGVIEVEPCEKCKEENYREGYGKGYDEGYDEGKDPTR